MKRPSIVLLASLALLGSAPRQANAQFGAGDIVFDPTAFADLEKQVENGIATLNQLKQQYEALAHLPDNINGMAGALATNRALQNPFPQARNMGRLAAGIGLGNGAGAIMEQNRYYAPQGDDWTAQEMNRSAAGTANMQAAAIQHMQAVEERQQALIEFYQGIEQSPDIQQTAAIQARLQLEQNFIAGQQANAQQLMVLVHLQNRVDQQRLEERMRKSARELADAASGGGPGAMAME